MPWIVYNSTSRLVTGIYATQSAASAAAAADSASTAHGSETTGASWDEAATTGWYFTSGGVVQPLPPGPAPGSVAELRYEIRKSLGSFRVTFETLRRTSPGRNPETYEKLLRYGWRCLQGFYTLMRDTTISVSDRISISRLFAEGPADCSETRGSQVVPDHQAWWGNAAGLTGSQTSMSSFVTKTSPARVNLVDFETITGTPPAESEDLFAGEWVEEITS